MHVSGGRCPLKSYPKIYNLDVGRRRLSQATTMEIKLIANLIMGIDPDRRQGLRQKRDKSGATLLHCLLLANTEESCDLAQRLIKDEFELLLEYAAAAHPVPHAASQPGQMRACSQCAHGWCRRRGRLLHGRGLPSHRNRQRKHLAVE